MYDFQRSVKSGIIFDMNITQKQIYMVPVAKQLWLIKFIQPAEH